MCYYLTFRNKIYRLFYIYFHYIYLIIYIIVLWFYFSPVFPAGVSSGLVLESSLLVVVFIRLVLVSSLLVIFIRLVCLPC